MAEAVAALEVARSVVNGAVHHLAAGGRTAPDADQVIAYDVAHSAAAVAAAGSAVEYGRHGSVEASLAEAFAADTVWELAGRLLGREPLWGAEPDALAEATAFVAARRDPAWLAALAGEAGPRHLDPDFQLVADTFRRFAEEQIAPVSGRIHRADADVPEDIIAGLGQLGAFGLSIPAEHGGSATPGGDSYLGMVVATEELSRVSLAAGGSLVTRPEILARALLGGGTEEQKRAWLPKLASGEIMAAVAVTEPDHGSDVANITTVGRRVGIGDGGRSDGGRSDGEHDGDWLIHGTKTWCTFAARADVLMLLARTDPDRRLAHRGLSLFVVPKGRGDGRGFLLTQPGGGRLEGRPIDTIGYRGMHSYELSFDAWRVSHDHLIGGDRGAGRGFYLQMEGFDNGRLQTAARAVGVMQAAFELASSYAAARQVFGRAVGDYQLTQVKLARMAAVIQASRQHMYAVARLMAAGEGTLEASMIKAHACRAAEWVTREAVQIHGGMGYAEEDAVSRLFVDARVLSIFEGADEVLALKVIARRLIDQAAADPAADVPGSRTPGRS
jgi:(2S)-methylsuccinyl-CoA dehydrogenase